MGKIRTAIDNLFLNAEGDVYARSAHSAYPASNLALAQLQPAWRSQNWALELDGATEYAWVAAHADFNITGDLTMEVLCEPDNVTGAFLLIHKRDAIDGYSLGIVNGEIQVWIYDTSGTGNTGIVTTNTTAVAIDTWYRIKAVYDASAQEISIFRNGIEIARANNIAQTGCGLVGVIPTGISVAANLGIGATAGGASPFDGQIDFASISAVEYDHGGYIYPGDPVVAGYWKFHQDLEDSSGNGHTLTGVGLDSSNYLPCTAYHWIESHEVPTTTPDYFVIDRRHNLTSAATWRVLKGSQYTSYVSLADGTVTADTAVYSDLTTAADTDWWVEIHDPANTDGYLGIPFMHLGPHYDFADQRTGAGLSGVPAVSFEHFSPALLLGDRRAATDIVGHLGNQRTYTHSHPLRVIDGELKNMLYDLDIPGIRALANWCSQGYPFVFCYDPGDPAEHTRIMLWINAKDFVPRLVKMWQAHGVANAEMYAGRMILQELAESAVE